MLAPAKLNLYLHITGKREDGYHLLDSLVAFTRFGDEVKAEPDDMLSLTISGAFSATISAQDNLVIRAAEALQQRYQISQGARLTLEKRIPVGAGLGGGSSDAAAAMLLLNALWGIDAPLEELAKLAAPLGADVPACLYKQPLVMRSIGDDITLKPGFKKDGAILLVNPGETLLTAGVYQEYGKSADFRTPVAESAQFNFLQQHNDLEAPAISLCPVINAVLNALREQSGCQLARLCGSGATCFGWFENDADAENAKAAILVNHPDWWAQVTRLL